MTNLTADNIVRADALNLIEGSAMGRRDSEVVAEVISLYIEVGEDEPGRAFELVWHLAEQAAALIDTDEGRARLAWLRALTLSDSAQELDGGQ